MITKTRKRENTKKTLGFLFVVSCFRFFVPALVAVGVAGISLASSSGPSFTNVTTSAGIRFKHNNGAFGKKYLPETMGSGVAFFDADGDGWPDLLLINGKNWAGQPALASRHAFYRNNRDGTFSDVTARSALGVQMYGFGVAVGDYDNDGQSDVFITGLDGNRLFRNIGQGRFTDVTTGAGVASPGFSTSAAWFDYDRDGRLDLFTANYVEWTAATDLMCTLDGKTKSYCTPESYKGRSPVLFHNKGDGTFEDVTRAAGLFDPASKALGVALIDYDNDGWIDLVVANDTQPNRLYRNRRDGTFVDVGTTAGIAFNEAGVARAGMGVDAADHDGSGRASIIIGNFSNEMMGLYVSDKNGLFIDEAPRSAVGRSSLLTLTFGCFFFDYDLDGWLDIFAANGHVADDIERVQRRVTYAQPPHLFRNQGKGRFDAVSSTVGAAFAEPMVARGAAYADYDLDGDLDLIVTTNNGPAKLLRNDGGTNHALRMSLRGVTSNRDAIGARVTVKFADGSSQWRMVKSGSSYLSQSELPLTFGLGASGSVRTIDITWPNGKTETLPAVPADQSITIEEGRGIVKRAPLARGGAAP
jgi:enediyne biosynthesis protein E4